MIILGKIIGVFNIFNSSNINFISVLLILLGIGFAIIRIALYRKTKIRLSGLFEIFLWVYSKLLFLPKSFFIDFY